MTKNLKKREFLEQDKPLAAQLILASKMSKGQGPERDFSALTPCFESWLADINEQLGAYPAQ